MGLTGNFIGLNLVKNSEILQKMHHSSLLKILVNFDIIKEVENNN